jgi:hypothetical protein
MHNSTLRNFEIRGLGVQDLGLNKDPYLENYACSSITLVTAVQKVLNFEPMAHGHLCLWSTIQSGQSFKFPIKSIFYLPHMK